MKRVLFVLIICFGILSSAVIVNGMNSDLYVNLKDFEEINSSIGDLNSDGVVNSIDARCCLRAIAKVDEMTEYQKKIADVFGTGNVNAACARKILRVAAKLEEFDILVEVQVGQILRVDDIYTAGSGHYIWICEFPDESIKYNVNYINHFPPEDIGGPSEQIFEFYANEKGRYILDLGLKAYEDETPLESFRIILNVI